MSFFSISSIRNLLKKDGDASFSKTAIDKTRLEAERFVSKVGIKATEIAVHSGRKTVQARDIEFAIKNL